MEKLKSYLKRHDISASRFAETIGTSRGYLHDLMTGRRQLTGGMLRKIVAATGGEVTPNDLVLRSQDDITGDVE